jgi:hypothetical protein
MPDVTMCRAGMIFETNAREQSPGQKTSRAMMREIGSVGERSQGRARPEARNRFEGHVWRFSTLPTVVRLRETVTSFLRETHQRARSYRSVRP